MTWAKFSGIIPIALLGVLSSWWHKIISGGSLNDVHGPSEVGRRFSVQQDELLDSKWLGDQDLGSCYDLILIVIEGLGTSK